MGTQLQAGCANARGTAEYHEEGESLLAKELTDLQESYSKLNDEVIELRGWKRSALQVESQWDEQAVGRAVLPHLQVRAARPRQSRLSVL